MANSQISEQLKLEVCDAFEISLTCENPSEIERAMKTSVSVAAMCCWGFTPTEEKLDEIKTTIQGSTQEQGNVPCTMEYFWTFLVRMPAKILSRGTVKERIKALSMFGETASDTRSLKESLRALEELGTSIMTNAELESLQAITENSIERLVSEDDFVRILHKVWSLDHHSKQILKTTIKRWRRNCELDNVPVLFRLIADLRQYLWNQEEVIGSSQADTYNAVQLTKNSEPNTIWHAVSNYSTEEGRRSWRLVKAVSSCIRARFRAWKSPWMLGHDRGVFGETPLHLLLLCNRPSPELFAFFIELWDLCPDLHTAKYTHRLYRGENVLHIAIIKRAGLGLIRRIVEGDGTPCAAERGARLLRQRAVGDFFVSRPREGGSGANALGEFPLCFAAVTNQPDVFGYLVDAGASLEVELRQRPTPRSFPPTCASVHARTHAPSRTRRPGIGPSSLLRRRRTWHVWADTSPSPAIQHTRTPPPAWSS